MEFAVEAPVLELAPLGPAGVNVLGYSRYREFVRLSTRFMFREYSAQKFLGRSHDNIAFQIAVSFLLNESHSLTFGVPGMLR